MNEWREQKSVNKLLFYSISVSLYTLVHTRAYKTMNIILLHNYNTQHNNFVYGLLLLLAHPLLLSLCWGDAQHNIRHYNILLYSKLCHVYPFLLFIITPFLFILLFYLYVLCDSSAISQLVLTLTTLVFIKLLMQCNTLLRIIIIE